jgi:hypothetical protein
MTWSIAGHESEVMVNIAEQTAAACRFPTICLTKTFLAGVSRAHSDAEEQMAGWSSPPIVTCCDTFSAF